MMTGSSTSEFQIEKRKPLPARTDAARVAPKPGDLSGVSHHLGIWIALGAAKLRRPNPRRQRAT